MHEENKITFTVNHVNAKKNTMDGMVALKKIEHFSYALTDQIGLGYSSHVYKGKNDKTNQIVAIKVIDIKKEDDLHKQFTNSEVNILQKIKNLSPEHLLKLEGVFKTKNNLYIITQFCEGKDLAKILRRRKTFTQQQCQGIMKQFLKGYAQLYSLKVVHRDLKLANIFVRRGKAILADFGFAIQYDRCGQKFDYNVGSPFYMPPQSLKFNRYSYKSDVWAIGVIAFELIYGCRPWKEKDDDILYEKIMTTAIDELFDPNIRVSENYKQFIRECLQIDFQRRATPQYVINFPWDMAIDYIDGMDENPHQKHKRTISLAKGNPSAQPMENKNMNYKPIHFDDMRQNQILKSNVTHEMPVSLMGREQSPSKEYHKKNTSLPAQLLRAQKQNTSPVYKYQPPLDKRQKRQPNMDNIPREPTSDTDIQSALLSQIQYCRFMFMTYQEMKNSSLFEQLYELSLQLGKRVMSKINYLARVVQGQESEPMMGVGRYAASARGKRMLQMIGDYREKYQQHFNYPSREIPELNAEAVARTIALMKMGVKGNQRLVELLVYLYQVLMIESQSDLIKFSKESKIDFLADYRNPQPTPGQTQRLMQKIQNLNL